MSDQTLSPGSLHRLIYVSRQRIPAEALEDEVAAIIRASIRNNRDVGVTGMLLVHRGYFVQALEGGAGAVMATYHRIVDDPRHDAAKVLSAGPASRREFGDWNMCAHGMSPADDAILTTLAKRQAFAPEAISGRAALRLLKAVRDIQARTQLSAMS
jgi:hypothetical protein